VKTSPVTEADLRASVLSVPPLARKADLSIDREQNARLLAHLRAGGISTFMYGGNANLYNIAPSEFVTLCELLIELSQDSDWMIPSVGSDFGKAHPNYYETEVGKGSADDVALIAYTSGTTGRSKGVLLSHTNMIATSESFASIESVRRGDNWLCYLPMGWVGDSMFSLSTSLVVGATCNCPESPETVQRDLRELGPSALLAPPRIWENMLTGLQVKTADASWLKRRVYEVFRAAAERRELLRGDGKPVPFGTRVACRLGEVLVYGPVRDQLGLRNARWCLSGGAPLGADTCLVSA